VARGEIAAREALPVFSERARMKHVIDSDRGSDRRYPNNTK